MAGRSSRSPAGLHASSPSQPRIQDILSPNIHSPSPRAQRLSGAPSLPTGRRNSQVGQSSVSATHSEGTAGNGFTSSRSTLIMPASPSPRRSASNSFVPRVVRGNIPGRETPGSSSHAPSVPSGRPPVSPSRNRRPSSSAAASLTTMHRTASTPSPTNTIVPPPSTVVSFPRPSYLDNSALRYCLQSESGSGVPPDLYRFDSMHAGAAATSSRRSCGMSSPSHDMDSDEESNASAGDRGRSAPPPRLASQKAGDTFMHLPTRWSDRDRCPNLSVSVDGRDLTFHGPNSGGDKDAAAARTDHPIPAACGIYYYEIEIVDKGQKGHISIGFGTDTVRLSRLPGWEGQSWGYHGDDGKSFASERDGSPYGPKFTTSDVIGCGIDYSSGQAFFTKNGLKLEPVFENLASVGDLYPTVGLRTPGEAIRANFGHEPFMFDIDSHVGQVRNRTWAEIQSTRVTWTVRGDAGTFTVPSEDASQAVSTAAATSRVEESSELSKPVNELVLAYLAHHGYAKTARAFKTQCDRRCGILEPPVEDHSTAMETDGDNAATAASPTVLVASSSTQAARIESGLGAGTTIMQSDTLRRQKIVHSIIDGDIDTAFEETRNNYPSVLEREGGIILFKLRCRKFVELVLEAAAAWRKVKEEQARSNGVVSNGTAMADGDSMDVDEDNSLNAVILNRSSAATIAQSPRKLNVKIPQPSIAPSKTPSQLALEHALANGQSLQADYKSDTRSEVQDIYKRTLSLVAYDDPLADDPNVPEAVKEIAGQAARDELAEEVNRAILESQGRPPHPALERLYRHTQACIVQLGWLGAGEAAFADMPKEFLEA
ncbi:hypothetical protein JB92DRAFT_2854373 [Gautieria morchelliformis]|nr:hypothetical protein JB92DRAFT_2854373 [Gautieria morchelliformis]